MDLVDHTLLSVTRDGLPVDARGWARLSLPRDPAPGGLLVPHHVCNNPRAVIVAVDGDDWVTEDTGIRTMEYCTDEADRAITELAVAALCGRVHFTRHSADSAGRIGKNPLPDDAPLATLRCGGFVLRLRQEPRIVEL